jgi:hypothetical protein
MTPKLTPEFGNKGADRPSRAARIRELFTEGRTIAAHTSICMHAGVWTVAENAAAALRQHQAEVRDALGVIIDGIPYAGQTCELESEGEKRAVHIWRQQELWNKEDYYLNFAAYVTRGEGNVTVANNLARKCLERFGDGPTPVAVVPVE